MGNADALLSGYVEHIIWKGENGFSVITVMTEDEKKEITVRGIMPELDEGENVEITGEWVEHPVYGRQIAVKHLEIKEPEDAVAIERYLSGGAIKGIGAAMAKRIVKKFGEKTFEIMEEQPERLIEIKGISERIARSIAEQMEEKRAMRRCTIFLQQLGVSLKMAMKIFECYGGQTIDIVKSNPYKLVEDIRGIGFHTADALARAQGIAANSGFRISSGIIYALIQSQGEGHMYLPQGLLVDTALQLLEFSQDEKDEILLHIDNLVVDKKLKRIIAEDEIKIFRTSSYYVESSAAKRLNLLNIRVDGNMDRLKRSICALERKNGIELDDYQREAVIAGATSGICVITGGPGTGKTTIIKLLLDYFDEQKRDVMLAAPTGRAAKRMTEATGYEARTIHRMLEVTGGLEGGNEFARNEENPLETDVVIIDEMSMVDIYLFKSLLEAISIGTRLLMVGDSNQLPSVGPGSVLKDIIASGKLRVVTLNKVFRQAAQSDIVMNAHRINNGDEIALDNKSSDFFFLQRDNLNVIIEGLKYLCIKKLPPYVGVQPYDIQVLTPMRRGPLGVENLNRELQEALNPAGRGKKEVVYGEVVFREGDKVMQIKNDYQLEWEIRTPKGIMLDSGVGVFNGDTGIIQEINDAAGAIKVKFDDGRQIEYTVSMLDELEHAYAVTIHKSQGSEYPAVVLPLLNGPQPLLNRNLLYTAITRAKKCVTIIGLSDTVNSMIRNDHEQVRYTNLKEKIREY